MAAENKNEIGVHHEKVSHAGEKPDRFVEYSEKMIDFSRRNAVTITLIAVTIGIGIFLVAKLADTAKLDEEAYGRQLSKHEYFEFQTADLSAVEKKARVETVLKNFKTLCEQNLGQANSLATLVALGTRAELAAEQLISEDAADTALWAWNTIKEKYSDSELAKATNPVTQANRVDEHIDRTQRLRTQIALVKKEANFDPEGLAETFDLMSQYGNLIR